MFSVLAKIITTIVKWYSHSDDGVKPESKPSLDDKPRAKKLQFKGTVTNLNSIESYGLVNKEVYFSFDVIYANQDLSVGNIVLVHAERKEVHHAWHAVSIKLLEDHWSSDAQLDEAFLADEILNSQKLAGDKMYRTETVDRIVTECNGKFGKLENDFRFSVNDGEIDFIPIVGDLLTVNICYSIDSIQVTSWKPKQIKCVEGVITAYENDCGIIDETIVFFPSLCRCRVQIFVGQRVSAMVATSKQGVLKWRAYSLCSSCIDDDIHRKEMHKPCLDDKEGIFITNPLNFQNVFLGKENSLKVTLQNNTMDALTFIRCNFQKKVRKLFVLDESDSEVILPKNKSIDITLHCVGEVFGQHEDNLFFEFVDFIIKRTVKVNIIHPTQCILQPTAPFSYKSKRTGRQIDSDNLLIIPGQKHFKPGPRFCNKLPACKIPPNLLYAVEKKQDLFRVVPSLFEHLSSTNYISKFKTLLFLEEIQMRTDIKRFDMFEVMLEKRGEYLSLQVPGLAEGRPSLIIGDIALLVPPYNSSDFAFEGCIHEVHQNDILLKFHDSFQNSYDGKSFNVRFQLSRTNFRRLHQCVHHALENHDYAIFPQCIEYKFPLIQINMGNNNFRKMQNSKHKPGISKSIKWKNLNLNWKQKEAIVKILEARSRPLPYIIFGPPGTGKTVTLVEAILQVFANIPDSRIIVCTPSNSAADLIVQRILESDTIDISDMVRLNSYQRHIDTVPDFIKPFCQDKNSLDRITEYRIVISTCSTAGSLYNIGLCNEYFTHVFIDEAGQLMEPESMIAVGFLDSETHGQIIMAGDPQQLGPVLRSPLAKRHGLHISYLERLMNTAVYARNEQEYGKYGGYNPLLVSMLEESYRSHPDILRFPSDRFYFSQVKCCVPEERHNKLSNWEELPKKGFPLIFHGIKGEELREENSPSWFNPTEVLQVTNYLQKLYESGLSSDDVGIIAPYKKQVEKIRLFLTSSDLEICKIGSVEEFQGQERRVIIISTVRSCDKNVKCDIQYNLGFISNPKRLNVAITRAQELLIVVGNPYILSKDHFWDSFIQYCVVNGGYTGCDLPLSFIQTPSKHLAQ